jgi:hypothetical protein
MGICSKIQRAILSFATNNGEFLEKMFQKDELDNIQMVWFPIYPVGKYPPNPWVCMIWDLVAQNGPMTGMQQIITLILR